MSASQPKYATTIWPFLGPFVIGCFLLASSVPIWFGLGMWVAGAVNYTFVNRRRRRRGSLRQP